MTRDELRAALDDKGIEYDARWGAERLQEALDAAAAPDGPQMVACVVLRDYWPTDNEEDRVRAGQIVHLEPMDALDKVEAGMVRRVK
jgi:hypothetical protein